MPKLFIYTLNWNAKDKITNLYNSINKYYSDLNFEWYIKDNNSSDNSQNIIEEWKNPKINLIKYPHNKDNFAEGMNFLFKESKPRPEDYILLLNNDIIFNDSDSLNNMINLMKNDESIGAVGARLLYTNTNNLQHAGVVFFKEHKGTPFHYKHNKPSDSDAMLDREFQSVTGAVLLTKADIYEQAGQLDPKMIWAFDDTCFTLNVKYNLNKKIVYCGRTNIFHEESGSLKKNPINKLYMTQNVNRFKQLWSNKIEIDEPLYRTNPNYGLYKNKSF